MMRNWSIKEEVVWVVGSGVGLRFRAVPREGMICDPLKSKSFAAERNFSHRKWWGVGREGSCGVL